MNNIIIIPARGNSKRLPKKNIMLFNAKPLIAHSIEYAKQNSDIVSEIYVSTDNNDIKQIALQYGAKVVDRPIDISGDTATTVLALKHVIENLDTQYENVILLQPTNPLRPKHLLKEAYNKFLKGDYNSLMTVSRIKNKLGKIIDNKFVPINYKIGQRSQDLEPLYAENGLLYITKTRLILEEKILGDNNYPFVINHPYAKVDIDTEEDFKFAKYILDNYPNE
jgi:CMP-N-acetylneuraminic acid synthetase